MGCLGGLSSSLWSLSNELCVWSKAKRSKAHSSLGRMVAEYAVFLPVHFKKVLSLDCLELPLKGVKMIGA